MLSDSIHQGFAYISGIRSEDVQLTAPNYELTVNVTVQQSDNGANNCAVGI